MSISGEVRTLYSDREQTKAVFPRTKTDAVSDDNGVGLNAILENMVHAGAIVSDAEVAPVNADTLGGKLPSAFAPSGYGLGVPYPEFVSDANNAGNNGWYRLKGAANIPAGFSDGWLFVSTYDTGYKRQDYYTERNGGIHLVRYMVDNGWKEWEWVNPPMVEGVEYRTTERWSGLPVYTKLIDYGDVGSGYSRFDTGCGTRIIRASATHGTTLVPFGGVGELWGVYGMSIGIGVNNLHFYSGAENGTANLTVQLWYIK